MSEPASGKKRGRPKGTGSSNASAAVAPNANIANGMEGSILLQSSTVAPASTRQQSQQQHPQQSQQLMMSGSNSNVSTVLSLELLEEEPTSFSKRMRTTATNSGNNTSNAATASYAAGASAASASSAYQPDSDLSSLASIVMGPKAEHLESKLVMRLPTWMPEEIHVTPTTDHVLNFAAESLPIVIDDVGYAEQTLKVAKSSPIYRDTSGIIDQIGYTGGAIWGLAWCPVHYQNCAYVAVAVHPNDQMEHLIGTRYNEDIVLQIWKIDTEKPATLAFGIALAGSGYITGLQWCPWDGVAGAVGSVEDANAIRRLGLLAVSTGDGTVRIISVPTHASESQVPPVFPAKIVWERTLPKGVPTCLCWSNARVSRLAFGTSTGDLFVFNISDTLACWGVNLTDFNLGGCVRAIAWSPDGESYLATGDEWGRLRLWSPRNCTPLYTHLMARNWIVDLAWPSSVDNIVVTLNDGATRIFDMSTETSRLIWNALEPAWNITSSENLAVVTLGSCDGSVVSILTENTARKREDGPPKFLLSQTSLVLTSELPRLSSGQPYRSRHALLLSYHWPVKKDLVPVAAPLGTSFADFVPKEYTGSEKKTKAKKLQDIPVVKFPDPMVSINKVSLSPFCVNNLGGRWLLSAGNAGILRFQRIRMKNVETKATWLARDTALAFR